VTGNVTLRLQNVPWDQALDIVLRTKGLDKRKQDNVIIVAPQEELASREKADLAAKKDCRSWRRCAPSICRSLRQGKGHEALIKSQGGTLLSARGNVAVDERTNHIVVAGHIDRLADIRRLVATLDIPVRQVLIEARIVVVNDDFKRDLGARVGYTTAQSNATASGRPAAAQPLLTRRLLLRWPTGSDRQLIPRAGSGQEPPVRRSATT